MFTGIIQAQGVVESIKRQSDALFLGINAPFADEVKAGDSICINGVCLTATRIDKDTVYFDVVSQTLKDTNLGKLKLKDKVNLEQSLKAQDKFGGHFVTGHIDTAGIIKKKAAVREQVMFEIGIDRRFMDGIVQKGSIAIDGISLTVAEVKTGSFIVNIIPHTLKVTTLGSKGVGDYVNIELDMLGKYARLNKSESEQKKQEISEDFLKEHGFN